MPTRRVVLMKIRELIIERKQDSPVYRNMDIRRVNLYAKRIEYLLYRMAFSCEEYVNEDSLLYRMKSISKQSRRQRLTLIKHLSGRITPPLE